jgi:mannose-6-phosphate isomerase
LFSGAISEEVVVVFALGAISGHNEGMPEDESGHRPWGTYVVLDDKPGHKVKRISVEPGKRLSYQYHEHRAEHWFVVQGQAVVTIDGEEHSLASGDAIDVPRRAKHRILNPGPGQLTFVEVQHGDYFGEDDIIRLDDDYGRVEA